MAEYVRFVDPDFKSNLNTLVIGYKSGTITIDDTAGITLQPDDIEHDVLVACAAGITQYQHLINDVANNNFLQFMTGTQLDLYGNAHSLPRLGAQKALTTVRFTFTEPLLNTKTIFQNTAVYNSVGTATYTFYTDESVIITAGQTFYDIDCSAETEGTSYNNLAAGYLDTLSTAIPFVDNVANTIITTNGADIEDDIRYKIRLQLADAKPAAGSEDAFKLLALSVSTELVDCVSRDANSGASPGNVDVYILKRDVADHLDHNIVDYAAVRTLVMNELNQTHNRPLNTIVNVYPPSAMPFTMTVSLSVWKNRDLTNLITDVQNVITEWRNELRNKLAPVFYDSVITNRIEKIPAIVQANVVVTWASTPPDLPKLSKSMVACLTAIPVPTILEYIEE